MKYLFLIIMIFTAAVFASTTPPTPAEMGLEPPQLPEAEPVFSGDAVATNFSFVKLPDYEWELTFECCPYPDFHTNVLAYPITVRVPFEADQGFVRVTARKVEVKP